MAVNPMQRRARNSFLIGFLVALIIMALVVLLLLYRIKSLNEAKEALESKQSEVYVAATDLKSGDEVTMASFKRETVQTTMDQTQIISSTDFEFIDEETGELIEKYAEDGTPIEKKINYEGFCSSKFNSNERYGFRRRRSNYKWSKNPRI